MSNNLGGKGGGRGSQWTAPLWWKVTLLICVVYNALFSWLYISGKWTAAREGCTVALSTLDEGVADVGVICGILAVVLLLGLYAMQKTED